MMGSGRPGDGKPPSASPVKTTVSKLRPRTSSGVSTATPSRPTLPSATEPDSSERAQRARRLARRHQLVDDGESAQPVGDIARRGCGRRLEERLRDGGEPVGPGVPGARVGGQAAARRRQPPRRRLEERRRLAPRGTSVGACRRLSRRGRRSCRRAASRCRRASARARDDAAPHATASSSRPATTPARRASSSHSAASAGWGGPSRSGATVRKSITARRANGAPADGARQSARPPQSRHADRAVGSPGGDRHPRGRERGGHALEVVAARDHDGTVR